MNSQAKLNSDNIIHHFKQCYLVSGLEVSRRFKQWLKVG